MERNEAEMQIDVVRENDRVYIAGKSVLGKGNSKHRERLHSEEAGMGRQTPRAEDRVTNRERLCRQLQ